MLISSHAFKTELWHLMTHFNIYGYTPSYADTYWNTDVWGTFCFTSLSNTQPGSLWQKLVQEPQEAPEWASNPWLVKTYDWWRRPSKDWKGFRSCVRTPALAWGTVHHFCQIWFERLRLCSRRSGCPIKVSGQEEVWLHEGMRRDTWESISETCWIRQTGPCCFSKRAERRYLMRHPATGNNTSIFLKLRFLLTLNKYLN